MFGRGSASVAVSSAFSFTSINIARLTGCGARPRQSPRGRSSRIKSISNRSPVGT
jgi:hypothetical protein